MTIHPYALLGQRDVETCVALARETIAQWEDGWCEKRGIEVSCAKAQSSCIPPGAHWTGHRHADGRTLWSYRSTEFLRQIEHLLFGLGAASRNADGRRESDIADDVARDALDDLSSSMLRKLDPVATFLEIDGEAPPEWQFSRSSGAALLEFASSGKVFGILLPHTMLPRREKPIFSTQSTPLTSLSTALTGTQARLTAELEGVEISLGQLTTLSPGDVITLEHPLDQPLKVYSANRCLVALAHIGKHEDQRALQMFAATQK